MARILILNGSPNGERGNCKRLIQSMHRHLQQGKSERDSRHQIKELVLSEAKWSASSTKKIFGDLEKAEGFIFVTGTYWDSWGSPLQIFLENVTELEGQSAFLGKPAVVLVLQHSVGGKGVLSRLQGVLSTFGCWIPPMSGLVYSWVSQELRLSGRKSSAQKDLWSPEDLEIIAQNFEQALNLKADWQSWPVDRRDYRKVWLK